MPRKSTARGHGNTKLGKNAKVIKTKRRLKVQRINLKPKAKKRKVEEEVHPLDFILG